MKHKNAKLRLRRISPNLLPRNFNILLQLLNRILQRRPRIIHLIHDQHALAHQIRHLAQRRKVQPLRPGDLGARRLDLVVAKRLVQGEPDGLDGDVGTAGLLEEGSQNSRGHVAAAADGDHELRLEVGQELGCRLLAELVHL